MVHSNSKPAPPVGRETPSKEYGVALLDARNQHHGNVCTGTFLRPHFPYITEIVDRLGVKSILDYGCGKGVQYKWIIPDTGRTLEQAWGCEVFKYDPAYQPFEKEPRGRFDLVLCTHTLGMIPIPDHPWVIDRLYRFARKALYIAERLDPPRKVVGDPAQRPAKLGWGMSEWQADVQRPGSTIEVTLCCRHRDEAGGKIQRMTKWNGAEWSRPRQMVSGGGFADPA
jgi:hypothetical protein